MIERGMRAIATLLLLVLVVVGVSWSTLALYGVTGRTHICLRRRWVRR